MQASRDIPTVLIGIGIVLMSFMYWLQHFTPDRLMGAAACLFVGIAMLIFPGAPAAPKTDTYMRTRHYVAAAPLMHKLLWLLFGVAGLAVGWGLAGAMNLVR